MGSIDIYRNDVWVNPWNPALASLIRSNHDINFIPSNVKALALVCYITNYATKGDCNQYQQEMGAAFIRKAYDDTADRREASGRARGARIAEIDKFSLRAFNCLAYDREISGPLAANTLLDLPEYYTPKINIKRVNLWALCRRFIHIIFQTTEDEDSAENLVPFGRSRSLLSSGYDDYNYRGSELAPYSYYNYLKTITLVKYSAKEEGDILFDSGHPNHKAKVQRPLKTITCNTLVALMGPLSINESEEDTIQGEH